MSDLSFYSKQYGGTFHFLQFNVLYREEFLKSPEFQHFMSFIEKSFPALDQSTEKWGQFVEQLQLRKDLIDLE